MTVHCNLNASDYRPFYRHVRFRYYKIHWVYGGIVILLLLLILRGRPDESSEDKLYALLALFVIGVPSAVLFSWILRRFAESRFRGSIGEHVFEITENGITESSVNGKVETRLAAIRSVDETPQYFIIIT